MKKVAILIVFVMAMAGTLRAQTAISDTPTYTWPKASVTGQLGNYVAFQGIAPTRVTISWTVTGTAPAACTFRVEGSPTGAASSWTGLDATAPAADAVPCTSTNQISIADRPNQNLRIYLVTYTPGDGTTSVIFSETRGGGQ